MNAVTDVDKTWQTWTRGDHLEVINLWWRSGSACEFRITFHFLHHCGFLDINFVRIFLIQSETDLYHTWRND